MMHHDECLLVRLQTGVRSDGSTRSVVASGELASQQELLALTTTEGVVANESFEDCSVVECVEDFAREQLQSCCIAGLIVL